MMIGLEPALNRRWTCTGAGLLVPLATMIAACGSSTTNPGGDGYGTGNGNKTGSTGPDYVTATIPVEESFSGDAVNSGTLTLPNGKTVTIRNGQANIAESDSIEAGTHRVVVQGSHPTHSSEVDIHDGTTEAVRLIGDDIDYQTLTSLMRPWLTGTSSGAASGTRIIRRWQEKPRFFFYDRTIHEDCDPDNPSSGLCEYDASQIPADSAAVLRIHPQFIDYAVSVIEEDLGLLPFRDYEIHLESSYDGTPPDVNGEDGWYVFCSDKDAPFNITQLTMHDKGTITFARTCQESGAGFRRDLVASDIWEGLAFDTNRGRKDHILDSDGRPLPFLETAVELFYGGARPPGSGAWNLRDEIPGANGPVGEVADYVPDF